MKTRYYFLAATSLLLVTLGPLQGVAQIPTEGLVAYYPFNGNANDESGNGNNGTLLGGATTTTFLQLGDNASDALSLPYTILDGLTDFTFAAFLQIDQLHTEGGFLTGANVWMGGAAAWHPGGNGFNLTYDATIQHWRTLIVPPLQTNYFFDYDITIEDHTWHHVAVTRQGTFATLYIDGTQVGFPTEVPDAAFDCDPGGFIIGQEQDYVGGGFQQVQSWAGRIDEFVIYNRPLSSSEISGLAGTMSSGLVAYYPFNGNANDESGNGNNGVVHGAMLTADRFGTANTAYRFSGNNAYIDIGANEMLRITGDITIAAWIRVDDFPTWFWEIVGWGAGGDDEAANQVWNFHILNNSGNTYLRHSHETGDGINTDVISTRALQTDNWIHAAITRNTILKTYRFYINGVPEADIAYELNPTGGTEGTAWIGWSPSGDPITAFNGIIDDIRIYNRTKSDSEVMEMYLADGGLVSVNAGSSQLPKEFSLLQNYPNPFNPSTTIRFSLARAEHVKISVYDVLGELVGTALDEERDAGTYTIKYAPENLATGSYFYRIQAGTFVATRKFLLIR